MWKVVSILIIVSFLISCYHTDKYKPYRPKSISMIEQCT